MPAPALDSPARRYGWTHWTPDRCPYCGRGLSDKYRAGRHPRRVPRRYMRRMSHAYRQNMPLCVYLGGD